MNIELKNAYRDEIIKATKKIINEIKAPIFIEEMAKFDSNLKYYIDKIPKDMVQELFKFEIEVLKELEIFIIKNLEDML